MNLPKGVSTNRHSLRQIGRWFKPISTRYPRIEPVTLLQYWGYTNRSQSYGNYNGSVNRCLTPRVQLLARTCWWDVQTFVHASLDTMTPNHGFARIRGKKHSHIFCVFSPLSKQDKSVQEGQRYIVPSPPNCTPPNNRGHLYMLYVVSSRPLWPTFYHYKS